MRGDRARVARQWILTETMLGIRLTIFNELHAKADRLCKEFARKKINSDTPARTKAKKRRSPSTRNIIPQGGGRKRRKSDSEAQNEPDSVPEKNVTRKVQASRIVRTRKLSEIEDDVPKAEKRLGAAAAKVASDCPARDADLNQSRQDESTILRSSHDNFQDNTTNVQADADTPPCGAQDPVCTEMFPAAENDAANHGNETKASLTIGSPRLHQSSSGVEHKQDGDTARLSDAGDTAEVNVESAQPATSELRPSFPESNSGVDPHVRQSDTTARDDACASKSQRLVSNDSSHQTNVSKINASSLRTSNMSVEGSKQQDLNSSMDEDLKTQLPPQAEDKPGVHTAATQRHTEPAAGANTSPSTPPCVNGDTFHAHVQELEPEPCAGGLSQVHRINPEDNPADIVMATPSFQKPADITVCTVTKNTTKLSRQATPEFPVGSHKCAYTDVAPIPDPSPCLPVPPVTHARNLESDINADACDEVQCGRSLHDEQVTSECDSALFKTPLPTKSAVLPHQEMLDSESGQGTVASEKENCPGRHDSGPMHQVVQKDSEVSTSQDICPKATREEEAGMQLDELGTPAHAPSCQAPLALSPTTVEVQASPAELNTKPVHSTSPEQSTPVHVSGEDARCPQSHPNEVQMLSPQTDARPGEMPGNQDLFRSSSFSTPQRSQVERPQSVRQQPQSLEQYKTPAPFSPSKQSSRALGPSQSAQGTVAPGTPPCQAQCTPEPSDIFTMHASEQCFNYTRPSPKTPVPWHQFHYTPNVHVSNEEIPDWSPDSNDGDENRPLPRVDDDEPGLANVVDLNDMDEKERASPLPEDMWTAEDEADANAELDADLASIFSPQRRCSTPKLACGGTMTPYTAEKQASIPSLSLPVSAQNDQAQCTLDLINGTEKQSEHHQESIPGLVNNQGAIGSPVEVVSTGAVHGIAPVSSMKSPAKPVHGITQKQETPIVPEVGHTSKKDDFGTFFAGVECSNTAFQGISKVIEKHQTKSEQKGNIVEKPAIPALIRAQKAKEAFERKQEEREARKNKFLKEKFEKKANVHVKLTKEAAAASKPPVMATPIKKPLAKCPRPANTQVPSSFKTPGVAVHAMKKSQLFKNVTPRRSPAIGVAASCAKTPLKWRAPTPGEVEYNITPLNELNSDDEDVSRPHKPKPAWASWDSLKKAAQRQRYIDPESIFGRIERTIDLEEHFGPDAHPVNRAKYRHGRESGGWNEDCLKESEIRAFQKAKGYR